MQKQAITYLAHTHTHTHKLYIINSLTMPIPSIPWGKSIPRKSLCSPDVEEGMSWETHCPPGSQTGWKPHLQMASLHYLNTGETKAKQNVKKYWLVSCRRDLKNKMPPWFYINFLNWVLTVMGKTGLAAHNCKCPSSPLFHHLLIWGMWQQSLFSHHPKKQENNEAMGIC